jgi:hypothetical protein
MATPEDRGSEGYNIKIIRSDTEMKTNDGKQLQKEKLVCRQVATVLKEK